MSRRPARVTQADIARAIRAAEQVGPGRVVDILPDGTIRISPQGERAGQGNPPLEPEKEIRL